MTLKKTLKKINGLILTAFKHHIFQKAYSSGPSIYCLMIFLDKRNIMLHHAKKPGISLLRDVGKRESLVCSLCLRLDRANSKYRNRKKNSQQSLSSENYVPLEQRKKIWKRSAGKGQLDQNLEYTS